MYHPAKVTSFGTSEFESQPLRKQRETHMIQISAMNRKRFRAIRKSEFKKLHEIGNLPYNFFDVLYNLKGAVLHSKISEKKFHNVTATGDKGIEAIFNEEVEGISNSLIKWFTTYGACKGDFIKLSTILKPFMPKITQKILGVIYNNAKAWIVMNKTYKNVVADNNRIDYHKLKLFCNDEGEYLKDRIAPMTKEKYIAFFQDLFRKRYPEMWKMIKPNVPLLGKGSIILGRAEGYSHDQYVYIKNGKIIFDMGFPIKQCEKKIMDDKIIDKDYYISLKREAEEIEYANNH